MFIFVHNVISFIIFSFTTGVFNNNVQIVKHIPSLTLCKMKWKQSNKQDSKSLLSMINGQTKREFLKCIQIACRVYTAILLSITRMEMTEATLLPSIAYLDSASQKHFEVPPISYSRFML